MFCFVPKIEVSNFEQYSNVFLFGVNKVLVLYKRTFIKTWARMNLNCIMTNKRLSLFLCIQSLPEIIFLYHTFLVNIWVKPEFGGKNGSWFLLSLPAAISQKTVHENIALITVSPSVRGRLCNLSTRWRHSLPAMIVIDHLFIKVYGNKFYDDLGVMTTIVHVSMDHPNKPNLPTNERT